MNDGTGISAILEAIKNFLDGIDIRFTERTDHEVLTLDLAGDNGRFTCYANPLGEDRFAFYAYLPVNVPPAKRAAMAELLTRINYTIWTGSFEMDFSDGELRFRTSGGVPERGLDDELIAPMFFACTAIMDAYLPAVMEVIYGQRTPEEILRAMGAGEEEEEEDDGEAEEDEEGAER